MKVVFVADNLNHHIEPLVKSMIDKVGILNVQYFVLCKVENSRVAMGFDASIYENSYVICLNDDINKLNSYWNDILLADLVLFSSRSFFSMAIDRCKQKKITFYFSERWFKPPLGVVRFLSPIYIKYFLQLARFSFRARAYYLGQGNFALSDLTKFRLFKNRSYQFAYFAKASDKLPNISDKEIDILWCGRMLKWKRVELLLFALSKVVLSFPKINVVIVGDGPERNKIILLIGKLGLNSNVTLRPFMPHGEVRKLMADSKIYVLPSTGYEGWGTVINEAILEGSTTLIYKDCGVSSMIVDGWNGFKFNNTNELAILLEKLLSDDDYRNCININAISFLGSYWSSEIAVERILDIYGNIQRTGIDKSNFVGIMERK